MSARSGSSTFTIAYAAGSGGTGAGIELGKGSAPALGHELELAVTVELVAKEVSEADRVGPDPCGHVGEGALVDLEQAELRIAGGEEG